MISIVIYVHERPLLSLKEFKSFETFILTYIPMRYYLVDSCTDRGTCLFLTKEKMSIRVVEGYRSSGLLPLIPYIPMRFKIRPTNP